MPGAGRAEDGWTDGRGPVLRRAATVGITGSGRGRRSLPPGGMMTHDNSDGPWIQGPAHLRAKMRSGAWTMRTRDAQSWPGRLHGPHPALKGAGARRCWDQPVPLPPPCAWAAKDSASGPQTQPPGRTRRRHPYTCSARPEKVAPGETPSTPTPHPHRPGSSPLLLQVPSTPDRLPSILPHLKPHPPSDKVSSNVRR